MGTQDEKPRELSGEQGRLASQRGPAPLLGETVDALLETLVETGRSVRLAVATNSMWPALRPGDRVLVRGARAEALRLGDIVVIRVANARLIHRLIGRIGPIGDPSLLTKGDNCVAGDNPWPAGQLLGVVVAVERRGSWLDLRSARARLAGAIIALLSRWQWWAHRHGPGLASGFLCRLLGRALRGVARLAAVAMPRKCETDH